MDIDLILGKFSELKVLVVGDLMIDQYLMGTVARVSPEAPVPIVEWQRQENRLGGAANVASNLAALGAAVSLCGVVGKDEESELFFELLAANKLDASLVLQVDDRPTTIKSRIIANEQHLLRIDKEKSKSINERQGQILLDRIARYLLTHAVDTIVIQDYNKGVLTPLVIKGIIDAGHHHEIPIAVDPKFNNFWEYRAVQLFKPNFKEIKDVLPFAVSETKASLAEATQFIQNKLNCELLMVTLSDKGLLTRTENETSIHPTDIRQVADVCGAGDAVIAIAALSLAIGLSCEDMAVLANLAGGQIVERVGVVTIDRQQLAEEIKQSKTKV